MNETMYFAAGCFWGVQFYFDQVPGVVGTQVGYMGGKTNRPTYEQVCDGTTGHAEVVKVEFKPQIIPVETLLAHFFRMHDPTQLNRQGPDIGDQYRSAIFFTNVAQQTAALRVRQSPKVLASINRPIVTAIEPATTFWVAEDYHQKYAERTGRGMCHVDYVKL